MTIVEQGCLGWIPPVDDSYRIGTLAVPRSVNHDNPRQWVVRVQAFDSGGFEAYVSRVDLGKLHRFCDMMAPVRGRREQPEVLNEESRLRAARRARREVRLIARNLACDRLMTLTTRESENTIDELCIRFAKARRAYRTETGEDFHYVGVPEPHPTNPRHFHLHLAVHGFVQVEVFRRHWWAACGGPGMGNIDVQKRKGNAGPTRVARYISKYIGKAMTGEDGRFNRKRYIASRKTLPLSMRSVLAEAGDDDMVSAFERLRKSLGIGDGLMASIAREDGVWFRPDGLGFWIDWDPQWGSLDLAPF